MFRKELRNGLFVLSVAAVVLCGGCASKWSMKTDPEQSEVQWPQPPASPKVRHIMTLRGFRETGVSFGAVLRSIVFGGTPDQEIARPVAVATGRDGRIAIADIGSKSVHLFLPKEQRYLRILKADSADLASPVGVAFDDESRLYISDSVLNRIVVFDAQGTYLFSMTPGRPSVPKRLTGLAYDREKKVLYAVDTLGNKVYALTADGGTSFSLGERGTGNGQFNYPTHIYSSSSGLLYVTDAMNFRIQVFEFPGSFVTAFGHHGDGSGDFAMPKGVASDKDGTIYVVDSLFDNIQLFNLRGEFLLTLGGRGSGNGEFWLPSGIFIDDDNKLYVCDTFNQRVQIFRILQDQHP